jgi:phosphoesterase RecJ-like protein
MFHFLKKKNHKVNVISPNDFPEFLKWLPASDEIINASLAKQRASSLLDKADIIFCLDFNSIERAGLLKEPFIMSKAVKVLIDHHPQPEVFCSYMFSTIETSSTGELVFEFINMLGEMKLLDKNIAECLYTGIMTDTGSFSYSCNFPKTYTVTAELVGKGLDAQLIHNLVYDTFSENRMRLYGFSLNSAMKVFPDFHAAYIALTKEDLKNYKHQIGDTEGFVNLPISIQGICLSALFMEMKDHIKISFRSKGEFNVNEFARKHFEGGGHKNAAGGKAPFPLSDVIEKFEKLLPQYKDKLDCS